VGRTRARADSALALISDSEFTRGQVAIDAAAAEERDPVPVLETIDLLIFRNGATEMPASLGRARRRQRSNGALDRSFDKARRP
jgi:hypothetical protein